MALLATRGREPRSCPVRAAWRDAPALASPASSRRKRGSRLLDPCRGRRSHPAPLPVRCSRGDRSPDAPARSVLGREHPSAVHDLAPRLVRLGARSTGLYHPGEYPQGLRITIGYSGNLGGLYVFV